MLSSQLDKVKQTYETKHHNVEQERDVLVDAAQVQFY